MEWKKKKEKKLNKEAWWVDSFKMESEDHLFKIITKEKEKQEENGEKKIIFVFLFRKKRENNSILFYLQKFLIEK